MIERMSVEHDKYLNLTRGDQNATRRTFLKGMLTAAAGVGTAAAMARFGISPWGNARAVSAGKVAVIGAGIAGLRAAWELTNKGKQVTVFDLRAQTGGRIQTRFWPNGAHSEDGMEEFNGSDTFLWDFMKKLHVPADQLAAKDAYFFRGKYSDHASGVGGFTQMISELMTPDEQAFYYGVAGEITNLAKNNNNLDPPITNPIYQQFDTPDFDSWIQSRPGSETAKPGVRAFMDMNIFAESDAHNFEVNLFEGLSMYDMYYNDSWWFAHNGNSDLTNTLAAQLPAGSVKLNAHVEEVVHAPGGKVKVTYHDTFPGEPTQHEDDCIEVHTTPKTLTSMLFDAAIVTVPSFCVTGAGDATSNPPATISDRPKGGFKNMVPEMSVAKAHALNSVPYASYLFPAYELPEAYHHTKENLSTWSMNTDTILNYIICQWHNQESTQFNKKNGFLFGYICGEQADQEAMKTDAQVLQDGLDAMNQFWKSVKSLPWQIRSSFVLRHLDLHYPFMNPGYIQTIAPKLWEPVGDRIFFAGDYLNGEGDANGASQSGVAAASNIT